MYRVNFFTMDQRLCAHLWSSSWRFAFMYRVNFFTLYKLALHTVFISSLRVQRDIITRTHFVKSSKSNQLIFMLFAIIHKGRNRSHSPSHILTFTRSRSLVKMMRLCSTVWWGADLFSTFADSLRLLLCPCSKSSVVDSDNLWQDPDPTFENVRIRILA
jgi:hypothetical protein